MVDFLEGFTKRRKITVSHANIDANLTHFPLPIFLSGSAGTGNQDVTDIFDEIGADYGKSVVTLSDGVTPIPAEADTWDAFGEIAVLWVSASDFVLAGSSDTDLYIYYDAAYAGTAYIAGPGSQHSVWDSATRSRWGLGQIPVPYANAMIDSTSYNHHGACHSLNSDDVAAGLIGNGIACGT